MVQGIVIRGTTPKHEFDLTQPAELIDDIRVIYGQKGKALFTKTWPDCQIVENKIIVSLLQEETLLLRPDKLLNVEVILKLKNEQVIGSPYPITFRVVGSMNEEIID